MNAQTETERDERCPECGGSDQEHVAGCGLVVDEEEQPRHSFLEWKYSEDRM